MYVIIIMRIPSTTLTSISYHFLRNNIREIFYPSVNKTPLGRWGIKEQQQKVDLSIMYANEDHCGLCNDYAANINKIKNNKV